MITTSLLLGVMPFFVDTIQRPFNFGARGFIPFLGDFQGDYSASDPPPDPPRVTTGLLRF